jgi:type II secretory pathway pseudopilin PulG
MRTDQASPEGERRLAGKRGFTLVEAMIAALIFVMFTLGIYGLIIESYNMTARIRYRDDARAVLLTFSDQFERLATTTGSVGLQRWLFYPASSPGTGWGLKWGALSDDDASIPQPSSPPDHLDVTIGGAKNPITASVRREVYFVQPDGTTSNVLTGVAMSSAGWLLVGKFTISYTANGRPETASMTVVRSVP